MQVQPQSAEQKTVLRQILKMHPGSPREIGDRLAMSATVAAMENSNVCAIYLPALYPYPKLLLPFSLSPRNSLPS